MYDLPRRCSELRVELEGGAVVLFLEPLDDATYFRVTETATTEGDGDEQRIVFHASRIPGLFEQQLRRAEGVQADGEMFDPKNPDHLARIPQPWKGAAVGRLIRYAMGLDREMGNDSKPQDAPSPAAETPSKG